jgi:hypothetical protein
LESFDRLVWKLSVRPFVAPATGQSAFLLALPGPESGRKCIAYGHHGTGVSPSASPGPAAIDCLNKAIAISSSRNHSDDAPVARTGDLALALYARQSSYGVVADNRTLFKLQEAFQLCTTTSHAQSTVVREAKRHSERSRKRRSAAEADQINGHVQQMEALAGPWKQAQASTVV